MAGRRLILIGFCAIAVGLLVIGVVAIAATTNLFVGLIVLLLTPLLIAFCGTVLVFFGLFRTHGSNWAGAVRRLIGLAAVAGMGGGLAWGALGVLSQLPDYAAGLNGAFMSGAWAITSTLVIMGVGLAAGGSVGAVIALIWWNAHRRAAPGDRFAADASNAVPRDNCP
ncbi:MAG TPA: hypothetical protein VGM94_14790 [Galbitalea sp.]|jgi:hypothetical protein